MSVIQLNGTLRKSLGKGGARKARAAGQIPGVIYGHGETPMSIAIDNREFITVMRTHKGGNAIVNLKVGDGEYTALVRDAQMDPLSRKIVHLDFQHISLTETIEVEVVVHPTGLAVGVKDGGGILELITRQVTVRCLPTAIPPSIDIDVTALNIGESLHVRDLVASGITILTDPDTTVITIVAPTVEEVAPVEGVVVEGEAAAAEPEVVGAKGKKEEGEEAAKAEKGEKGEKGEKPAKAEKAEREKK
jgi:large subunit ribosomal protein L25